MNKTVTTIQTAKISPYMPDMETLIHRCTCGACLQKAPHWKTCCFCPACGKQYSLPSLKEILGGGK